MTVARDLPALIREAGLEPRSLPSLLRTWSESVDKLERARAACAGFNSEDAVAFACGSLGRREFTPGSDLDLAFVHRSRLSARAARDLLNRIQKALRREGFNVSGLQKATVLFGAPVRLEALAENVGGDHDRTRYLTYRALIITEGEWLSSPAVARDFKDRILGAYVRGVMSKGRYLTSLTNDLHRYYRTLCVDYRWKVEGAKKHGGWAIRNVKLRHSRKLWHLGNICAECSAFLAAKERRAPPHDAILSQALQQSSFEKILGALGRVGASRRAGPLLRRYDFYLHEMRRRAVRDHLDSLLPEKRDSDEVFGALRRNARHLDAASQRVVWALLDDRGVAKHLLRYGLL